MESEPGQQVPICIKGKRACPPENVGSARMYAYFLETLRNPEHPEYPGNDEFPEYFGDEFDLEAFDLEETNETLRELR